MLGVVLCTRCAMGIPPAWEPPKLNSGSKLACAAPLPTPHMPRTYITSYPQHSRPSHHTPTSDLYTTSPIPAHVISPLLCKLCSRSTETFVEVQEGMEIDRGYISPQFVTNNERLLVEYDNCRVLVTDQKIESIRDIVPILEQVTRMNQPLLIIAEDVTGGW